MNKDKLTARCHKISKEKKVPFNVVMTYYFLESILSKIASSSYQSQFIFKGGFLLSNVIGVESRTTTDMDFVLEHLQMDKDILVEVLKEILVDDLVTYTVTKATEIRDEDPYGGYRISVLCQLENIKHTIPLDIATGDPITPKSIKYQYSSLFFEEEYPIFAYNLETILAEKLETIYRRAFLNTRSKDYYDIYILCTLKGDSLDYDKLYAACQNTFAYRNTKFNLDDFSQLLIEIGENNSMQRHWTNYQRQHHYAREIRFSDVIQISQEIIAGLKGSVSYLQDEVNSS